MKKQFAAFTLAASLIVATAVPALAQSTGTLQLNGGSRTITTTAITMATTPLTGVDQTIYDTYDPLNELHLWDVVDATGLGDGWNVVAQATIFTSGAYTIPLTGFKIQLPAENIAVVDGNAAPTSTQTTFAAMTTNVQIAVAAPGAGMGSYTILPEFELFVPAETYAGTYTSTVTVTVSQPL